MPFSDEDIALRQAVFDEKEREQARHAAWKRQREELLERLKADFPTHDERILLEFWDLATALTDKLVQQFREGESRLESSRLKWRSDFEPRVDGLPHDWTKEDRINLLTEMARQYNDIGQQFSAEWVRNSELRRDQKSFDPQVRVTATAPIPTTSSL